MASTSSERTPLVSSPNPAPSYVFQSNRLRQHKHRIRQFQCCICATMLALFVVALVITISYTMNEPDILPNNTDVTNTTETNVSNRLLLKLSWPIEEDDSGPTTLDDINDEDLKAAGLAGATALEARDRYEKYDQIVLPQDSPSYRHQKATATSSDALVLARAGYAADYATKELVKRKNITQKRKPEWTISHIPTQLNDSWWPADYCQKLNEVSDCVKEKYRSIDGSCNNLNHPNKWGVAQTPFRRALPPEYQDGISVPRKARNGQDLPSAREVSIVVHRPIYRNDPKFTVMLAVWGQFLDHDITATALNHGENGTSISCCPAVETPGLKPHPECFPVRLAPGDPIYQNFNLTCMEFVRSAPAPTCTLGPREQLNQVTSFIDGSVVYGSDKQLMIKLREMKDGLLRMYITADKRTLLPVSEDKTDGCNQEQLNKEGKYCFISGDARANENLHLTTMHLLLAREHNRIASKLKEINPHWNDEILFQESRRIVAAQMQHITYNEFLPVLLGPEIMVHADLYVETHGYYTGYNDSIDPSMANEFVAAVFRFAHTLLPTLMKKLANDTSSPEYIQMHKMLFNPYDLYNKNGMDSAIRGAINTNLEASDTYFSREFKEHLFEQSLSSDKPKKRSPCGLDLVSLNIQRGRDHGLPTYPKWRKFCGFSEPSSFDDLVGIIDPDSLDRIKSIYQDVNDIDLYTGALSEYPRVGGVLGDTVTCLITNQFVRLRRGDRFWYETNEQPQAFTAEQLTEIRVTTLARIICDNSDNITFIQYHVMLYKGEENIILPCRKIPSIDLNLWKEKTS